jgi:RNA polymerase sigma factor (sigma-70 family)
MTKGMRRRSDAELLEAAGGDPDAFAELYERHERALLGFVATMVRDPQVTVDVVAETFARAFEGRRSFRDELGTARPWLLGIARHVVLAGLRRGRVEREARARMGMDAIAVSDESLQGVERIVLESESAVVEAWLADLPEEQREAVRRRVLQDGSYDAIARDLRCSEAVVRQRVSRGLASLRRTALREDRWRS